MAWLLLAAVYVGRFSFSSSDEFLSSAAKQLEEVASLLLMNYSFVYFTGKVANKLSISFSRLSNSSSNLMDGLIHVHIACSMSILGLLIAGLVPTQTQLSAFFEQILKAYLRANPYCMLFPLKIFLNKEKFNTSLHVIHVEMI